MDLTAFANLTDIRLISPMLIVTVVGIVLLMLQVFQRSVASRAYLAWIAVLGLGLAGVDTLYLLGRGTQAFALGQMVFVDGFSLMLNLGVILAGILGCLISPAYLASHRLARGEYYALILFSVLGMMIMTSGADLFTLFMGLEMMSIPIYCLAGYFRHSARSAESAMKYFFLGAFASALFLYGIALLYGMTGTTHLVELSRILFAGVGGIAPGDAPAAAQLAASSGFLEYTGLQDGTLQPLFKLTMLPAMAMVMIAVSFAFKVSLVPFHMWTPDVYNGAPSSVVGFMSTAVKVAGFAAMIRIFDVAFFAQPARLSDTGWLTVFFWLAMLSMILGNVVAIVQRNVKRMLAYSSIAHAGYIAVGFLAASWGPKNFIHMDAVIFYLIGYTFSTLGAFAVLAYFGKRGEECQTYDDLAGIARRYPGAALAMTIFMFSSAGIPPTVGFLGKFYVFKAAIQTGEQIFIVLAVTGVLASVSGVYYYLKVIMAMYMKDSRREVREVSGVEMRAALVTCAVAVLFLGVYPSPVMDMARKSVVRSLGWPAQVRVELKKVDEAIKARDRAKVLDKASKIR